jgi:hypothetical protein
MSPRRAAVTIGVLYIIGDVAGFASLAVMPSLGSGSNLLSQIEGHRTAMIFGALGILVMGFALSALPAVFFPWGRRFNEALATGYLVFRGALEGVTYLLMSVVVLVLAALATGPTPSLESATVLALTYHVLFEQLLPLPFIAGAVMFYWLLFASRLVPRWISLWGLVTAPLYLGAAFARMAGANLDVLLFPLAVQEFVLAGWLIVRGFDDGVIRTALSSTPLAPCEGPI